MAQEEFEFQLCVQCIFVGGHIQKVKVVEFLTDTHIHDAQKTQHVSQKHKKTSAILTELHRQPSVVSTLHPLCSMSSSTCSNT